MSNSDMFRRAYSPPPLTAKVDLIPRPDNGKPEWSPTTVNKAVSIIQDKINEFNRKVREKAEEIKVQEKSRNPNAIRTLFCAMCEGQLKQKKSKVITGIDGKPIKLSRYSCSLCKAGYHGFGDLIKHELNPDLKAEVVYYELP